jgi:rRNA maturation protein Nop10
MFFSPETRVHDFTLKCKKCGQNVPAPVQTMPDSWIVGECPLCGEKRRYLPSDIFRGQLSYKLIGKRNRLGSRANG